VCKWIYDSDGIEALRHWTKMPLVDLTGVQPWVDGLATAAEVADSLRRLPFDMAVYAIRDGNSVLDVLLHFIPATMDEDLVEVMVAAPGAIRANDNTSVHVIRFLIGLNARADGALSVTSLMNDIHAPRTEDMDIPISADVADKCLSWVRFVLRTMERCSDYHLVQAGPANISARDRKTATKKPWLAETPRIILMNPQEAHTYGHRVERGGTHATPSPHHRRGHWATLRHEKWGDKRGRRIWRRPAWVGDQEWVFNGSRYKVIDPFPDDDAKPENTMAH
jgi:hypothetical protein